MVNADLLVWARSSARMSKEYAAKKIGVREEKLASWESGDALPTVRQLKNVAHVYDQSFAVFYLPAAPEVFTPPSHDYRLLPEGEDEGISPEMTLEMRRSLDRRETLLELLEQREANPEVFPVTGTIETNAVELAKELRKTLGVKLDRQAAWKDAPLAFNEWRAAVENLGVLVFQTSKVPLGQMRGFSIAKDVMPIVVLNRKDSHQGRCFTLMHELSHLALREGGVCDLCENASESQPNSQVEAYCNNVAGNVLVPSKALKQVLISYSNQGAEWEDSDLKAIARVFLVSREVVLRRLLTLNLTTKAFYEVKRSQFKKEYAQIERSKPKKSGGPPPGVNAVSLAGKPFVKTVLGAYYNEQIGASDASHMIGVRMKHFATISESIGVEY